METIDDTQVAELAKKRELKNMYKLKEVELLDKAFPPIAKRFDKTQVIQEGDKVLLVDNSGKMNLVKVRASKFYDHT